MTGFKPVAELQIADVPDRVHHRVRVGHDQFLERAGVVHRRVEARHAKLDVPEEDLLRVSRNVSEAELKVIKRSDHDDVEDLNDDDEGPVLAFDLTVPAVPGLEGRQPTMFRANYDAEQDAYRFTFSEFSRDG